MHQCINLHCTFSPPSPGLRSVTPPLRPALCRRWDWGTMEWRSATQHSPSVSTPVQQIFNNFTWLSYKIYILLLICFNKAHVIYLIFIWLVAYCDRNLPHFLFDNTKPWVICMVLMMLPIHALWLWTSGAPILFPSHHVIALYKSVSRQQLLSPLQSLASQ